MTTHDALAAETANFHPATAGKLKSARLPLQKETGKFGEALDKASVAQQQREGEASPDSLPQLTSLRSARQALAHVVAQSARDAAVSPVAAAETLLTARAEMLPATANQAGALHSSGITGDEELQSTGQDEGVAAPVHEAPRSDVAAARLEALVGSLLPGLAGSHRPETVRAGNSPGAASEARNQPAVAAGAVAGKKPDGARGAATQAAKPSRSIEIDDAPPVEIETNALPSPTALASAVATRAERPTSETARPAKLESVVVTRVETLLLPAGTGAGLALFRNDEQHASTFPAASLAAAPLPSLPGQAVVKTIELRLQPQELGDVKIAIHLRGEELRVQVEVSTREAHALLQRDKSALSQILEKAGYDLAESGVTLTLKPDPQPVASTPAGNDASTFNRNSNGNGGSGAQTFQQQADEQQPRNAARPSQREEPHGRNGEREGNPAARQAGSSDIYL